MMKIHGKVYPIQPFKCLLLDSSVKKLKEIAEMVGAERNLLQALIHIIDFSHALLVQHKNYVDNGEIPEKVGDSVDNEKKTD